MDNQHRPDQARCLSWVIRDRVEPAAGPVTSGMLPKAEVKSEHSRHSDGPLLVDGAVRDVIQAPKPEPRIMRYELSDYEWTAIKPMLPNKPRCAKQSGLVYGA